MMTCWISRLRRNIVSFFAAESACFLPTDILIMRIIRPGSQKETRWFQDTLIQLKPGAGPAYLCLIRARYRSPETMIATATDCWKKTYSELKILTAGLYRRQTCSTRALRRGSEKAKTVFSVHKTPCCKLKDADELPADNLKGAAPILTWRV